MKNNLFKWIVVLAVVFLVAEGFSIYRSLNFWKNHSLNGDSPWGSTMGLLDLSLPDLQQHAQNLHQWQGRVLVVNFWAPWCEPCKAELPLLNKAQAGWSPDQVRIVGIGIDEPQALREYLRQQPLGYPVLVGTSDTLQLTKAYGNSQKALPFTLVFDATGHVVLEKLGRLHGNELDQAILTATHARQS